MTPSPIPVFALPAELTIDRVEAVEAQAVVVVGAEGAHLVVDLAQTTFLCSSGLGMLVKLSKRLHERGGGLALARPPPPILRLLKIVGLDAVLPTFPSVETATGRLSQGRAAARP